MEGGGNGFSELQRRLKNVGVLLVAVEHGAESAAPGTVCSAILPPPTPVKWSVAGFRHEREKSERFAHHREKERGCEG